MRLDSHRRDDGRGRLVRFLLLWAWLALAACGPAVPLLPKLGPGDSVLAFGDSLTFGTGAQPEESYPSVLAAMIGRPVVNAGVPGEVTAQGLERLPAVLDEHRPKLVVLCMGGNDMLRKVAPADIAANLTAMVQAVRARGIAVLLVAVPQPSLFGGKAELYDRVAQDLGVPLERDVLSDVLFRNDLKSDAIHPNAAGYRQMAEAVARLMRQAGAL